MGTDSLYYIMDYSGNYYRTNQADQLVSVVSQQDAMVFTFAQANSRICVGKKAAFYCMIPIEDSEDETDAAECEEVSPDEEMGVNDMEKQENTGVEEYFSPVKELTYDELTEQAEKDVSSYDLSEIDWAEYLTHFTYLVEGLKDYREDLASKHSDIDQKICDILHYIELCETNDEEAIDLIELLRVCRPQIDPAAALGIKRRIDRSNQERTDMVEYIDSYLMDKYRDVRPAADARLNTETPAWAIVRHCRCPLQWL